MQWRAGWQGTGIATSAIYWLRATPPLGTFWHPCNTMRHCFHSIHIGSTSKMQDIVRQAWAKWPDLLKKPSQKTVFENIVIYTEGTCMCLEYSSNWVACKMTIVRLHWPWHYMMDRHYMHTSMWITQWNGRQAICDSESHEGLQNTSRKPDIFAKFTIYYSSNSTQYRSTTCTWQLSLQKEKPALQGLTYCSLYRRDKSD